MGLPILEEGEGPFRWGDSDRIRGNGFKLKEERFTFDVREKLIMQSMVRPWHRAAKLFA